MLQIRRDNRDNFGLLSIFFHKNVFCDPSLELYNPDDSNEGSQHTVSLRKKREIIVELSSVPPLIWNSAV